MHAIGMEEKKNVNNVYLKTCSGPCEYRGTNACGMLLLGSRSRLCYYETYRRVESVGLLCDGHGTGFGIYQDNLVLAEFIPTPSGDTAVRRKKKKTHHRRISRFGRPPKTVRVRKYHEHSPGNESCEPILRTDRV